MKYLNDHKFHIINFCKINVISAVTKQEFRYNFKPPYIFKDLHICKSKIKMITKLQSFIKSEARYYIPKFLFSNMHNKYTKYSDM